MERQVFVSHAADDPDWPEDAVEAVAEAIRDARIAVHLDLWHRRAKRRELSLAEWQAWMNAAVHGASHILCLVSPRYLRLWERRPEEAGGLGVAFESIRMIHGLYLQKQHNDGRIFTLRPEAQGFDCIPLDLAYDCPAYRWPAARGDVISHVAEADLPAFVRARAGVGASPAPESRSEPAQPSQTAPPAASPTPAAAPAAARAQSSAPSPAATPSPSHAENATPSWASASGHDDYGRWADLTIHGVTQRMRWIPPTGPEGFWMGSPLGERAGLSNKSSRDWANKTEHAPRREHVLVGFWLADTLCTQALWRVVADIDPSHFSTGPEAPLRPVENVSWEFVMSKFIARLTAVMNLERGLRVCLPSELEWEYAARAGTRTAYWWGDDWDIGKGNVDFSGKPKRDDKEGTTLVHSFPPNPMGLYDIHGNVWEWCEDPWVQRRDAQEILLDRERRVVRGGSCFFHPDDARSACRGAWSCWNKDRDLGFRFAIRSSSKPVAR